MNTTLKAQVVFSEKEVAEILTKKAEEANPGYKVTRVSFQVTAEEDPSDWRAEYALSHVFSKATVEMEKK